MIFWLEGVKRGFLIWRVFVVLLSFQLATASAFAESSRPAPGEPKEEPDIIGQLLEEGSEQGAQDPEYAQAKREALIQAEIAESSNPDQMPPDDPSADPLHLLGQSLRTFNSDKLEAESGLSEINITAPPVAFDIRTIPVEVDREKKTLSFVARGSGGKSYAHVIPHLDVLTTARHLETLLIVDSTGRVFAIDLRVAKIFAFKCDIPVVEVGRLPSDAKLENVVGAYWSVGLKPFSDEEVKRFNEESPLFNGGDFIVFSKGVGTEDIVLGVYNSKAIRNRYLSVLVSYAELVRRLKLGDLRPSFIAQAGAVSEDVPHEDINPDVVLGDPVLAHAIAAIPDNALAPLYSRIAHLKENADNPKDMVASLDDWKSKFEKIEQEANYQIANSKDGKWVRQLQEEKDLGDFTRSYRRLLAEKEKREPGSGGMLPGQARNGISRYLNAVAMKRLAVLTAGGAGAHELVQKLYGSDPLAAWATSFLNHMYTWIPSVLKDAAPIYRNHLLLSSTALSVCGIGIPYFLGLIGSRAVPGYGGWGPVRVIAALSYRITAIAGWPIIRIISGRPHSKYFGDALRAGISPFLKVEADSPLGQKLGLQEDIRVGVSNPVSPSVQTEKQLNIRNAYQADALNAIALQKNRATFLASVLANLAVSEEYDIDIGTLMAVEQGRADPPLLTSKLADSATLKAVEKGRADLLPTTTVLNSEKFMELWRDTAVELKKKILAYSDLGISEDLNKVDPRELAAWHKIARDTAKELREEKAASPLLARLKSEFRGLGSRSLKFIGNYGIEEFNLLWNLPPSDFVVGQFWRQFVIDYSMNVWQTGFWGGRADLSKPAENWAAAGQDGHWWNLWTARQNRADMFDEVRKYTVSSPAGIGVVWQRDVGLSEDQFDPVEMIESAPLYEREGIIPGMVAWGKGLLDIREADVEGFIRQSLVKRLNTLQQSLVMVVGVRMLFGQALPDAMMAFITSLALAPWWYGNVWPLLLRGNQMYEHDFVAKKKEFEEARIKISQGMRLKREDMVRDGEIYLVNAYRESGTPIPKTYFKTLAAAQELLSVPKEEQLQIDSQMRELFEPLAVLYTAMNAKGKFRRGPADEGSVRAAYESVVNLYKKQGLDENVIREMNLRSLLLFSRYHPPIKANNTKVEKVAIFIGSLTTNYLASFFCPLLWHLSWGWVGSYVALSAFLYFGAFYAQQGLIKVQDRLEPAILRTTSRIKDWFNGEPSFMLDDCLSAYGGLM